MVFKLLGSESTIQLSFDPSKVDAILTVAYYTDVTTVASLPTKGVIPTQTAPLTSAPLVKLSIMLMAAQPIDDYPSANLTL